MRLSGSAPDSETHWPDEGRRRISRNEPIASGSANCSPDEAGDEAAATDFAARLEPAVHAQRIPPRRQPSRLLREQAPNTIP